MYHVVYTFEHSVLSCLSSDFLYTMQKIMHLLLDAYGVYIAASFTSLSRPGEAFLLLLFHSLFV